MTPDCRQWCIISGKALKEPFEDPEHIHQLRVSVRRAVAALDIFAPCLPRKVCRSSRRSIRDIRRAAGAARDWDVFLAHLPVELPKRSLRRQPGLDFLAGYALDQRLQAQRGLEEASTDYPEAFERLVQETRNAVREPDGCPSTLGELGRGNIVALLQELEEATTQDLGDYAHLHRVRIIGKRLRYAMEIFVDCYPPAFRETLYPMVEEMQDILGRANDSFVARQRLRQLSVRPRRGLSGPLEAISTRSGSSDPFPRQVSAKGESELRSLVGQVGREPNRRSVCRAVAIGGNGLGFEVRCAASDYFLSCSHTVTVWPEPSLALKSVGRGFPGGAKQALNADFREGEIIHIFGVCELAAQSAIVEVQAIIPQPWDRRAVSGERRFT